MIDKLRAVEKLKIAILANCQGNVIKNLIKKHLPQVDFIDIPAIHLLKKDEYNKIYSKLESMDFIITQPLSNNFDSLNINNLNKYFTNKLIVFPVLYFNGFNPEMIYLRNLRGQAIKDFGIDYHDLFILFGYINKKSVDDVLSWFEDKSFFDHKFIEKNSNSSIGELEKREAECDIHISNFLKKNCHTKTFHTINHPNNLIISDVSRQILQLLGYFGKFNTLKSDPFKDTSIPSYASVSNYYGYNHTNIVTVHNNQKTKKDMIIAYYKFYDTVTNEILQHNIEIIDHEMKTFLKKLI